MIKLDCILDVTVLSIDDGIYEIKAIASDLNLGGEDFDNMLLEYFAKEFKKKHKLDLHTSPKAMRRLKTQCERAKKTLSSSKKALIEIDSLFEGIDFMTYITRTKFEDLCIANLM